jgi:hypothetical protein
MKKTFTAIAVIPICAIVAAAQDVPKMETFLGYTYLRANSAANASPYSANGGSGQFAYNFNKWVGGVADLGAVHNGNLSGAQIDNTTANFLFGPRLSFRHARLRPYVEILWGGVYQATSTRVNVVPINPAQPIFLPGRPATLPVTGQPITGRLNAQQTAFAMSVGGGLDIRINRHVSFRPFGLDYYMTRLQNLRTMGDNNQNNIRYTAGFNFTFGAR